MYKCENKKCGETVPHRTPTNIVTLETREKMYETPVVRYGRVTQRLKQTMGYETVIELRVCPACYEDFTGEKPREARPSPRINNRPTGFKRRPPSSTWKPKPNRNAPTRKKPTVEKINTLKS